MSEDYGTISPCYTMTFVRRSKHSAARLWAAITEPDEVSTWMEGPATVDLRPGGVWNIDFSDFWKGRGREDAPDGGELDGIIVRVEPERVLAFAWGTSIVQWTIEDHEGDGCTYTFVHTGCADSGEDEEGLAAGWHGFLDQLDATLDGMTWSRMDAEATWQRRKARYRERLEHAIAR